LTRSKGRLKIDSSQETEDATLKEEEKRKKARKRKRGPYRKAHANW
jgi:hypothetical protein